VGERRARLQSATARMAGGRGPHEVPGRAPAAAGVRRIRARKAGALGPREQRTEGDADAVRHVQPDLAFTEADEHRQRRVGAGVVLQLHQLARDFIPPVRSARLRGEPRLRPAPAARRAVDLRLGRSMDAVGRQTQRRGAGDARPGHWCLRPRRRSVVDVAVHPGYRHRAAGECSASGGYGG
jgi:hypothetical protein